MDLPSSSLISQGKNNLYPDGGIKRTWMTRQQKYCINQTH